MVSWDIARCGGTAVEGNAVTDLPVRGFEYLARRMCDVAHGHFWEFPQIAISSFTPGARVHHVVAVTVARDFRTIATEASSG
jgi:hypothetical protein